MQDEGEPIDGERRKVVRTNGLAMARVSDVRPLQHFRFARTFGKSVNHVEEIEFDYDDESS